MNPFLLLFALIAVCDYQPQAYRTIVFFETATVGRDRVTITGWHSDKSTFMFFTDSPDYDNVISYWNTKDHITFYEPMKTTGYEEDGCYFEQYEVSTYNNLEITVSEIVYIKWYPKNHEMDIIFPDRIEKFKGGSF